MGRAAGARPGLAELGWGLQPHPRPVEELRGTQNVENSRGVGPSDGAGDGGLFEGGFR